MRILFSGYPSPFVGGGQISALTLLKRLAQQHEVTAFGIPGQPPRDRTIPDRMGLYKQALPYLLGKRLFPYDLRILLMEIIAGNSLSKLIEKTQPELIIVQEPAVEIPRRWKTKTLVFVRYYDYWFNPFYSSWWKRIYNEPFSRFRSRRNLAILQEAHLVLANSKFTAKRLYEVGIEAEVVYPFIDLSSYKVPRTCRGDFILFIGPTYLKGVNIVLQIAKKLPGHKFLIVGSISQSLEKQIRCYENIELRCFCDDMKEVYAKGRIVLAPSICEEAFGRIPIEAGISGIPTIASNRGGLPESVGEGGILIKDVWDIGEWTRAIEELDDPKTYKELSERAMENAQRFGLKKTFQGFKELIDASFNLPEPL